MVEPFFQPIQPGSGVQPAKARSADPVAGAANGAKFQALLEELELRAQEMSRSAREPLSAEELPHAVENARASLEDALRLSQSLLEACRQSAAQAPRAGRP